MAHFWYIGSKTCEILHHIKHLNIVPNWWMSQGKSKIIIIWILRFLNGVFVSIWILKSDILQAVFLWKQEVCQKGLNPENLSWDYYLLVFTKLVNSNFRASLLVPLTQNILGYSLFGTGINIASCFAIVFLVANESAGPTKTMQTTKFGLLVFIGGSRKLFSDWICNKIYSENVFDKIIPLSDLIYYYKN